jgi:hypothetical protein
MIVGSDHSDYKKKVTKENQVTFWEVLAKPYNYNWMITLTKEPQT